MISERQVPAKGSIGRSSPEPRRQPEQPAAGARLQLEEPAIGRVVEAVLSALAQRPADAQRNTPATRDVGMRPIEADWLRELQALQEEQRQARAQVAALQLRLERQESDTLQRWGAIVATAIGLVAAALLLRLARERVLPRLAGVLGRGEEPESLPANRPRPGLVSETAPPGTAHAQLTRGESPAGLAGRFEGTAKPSPPGHWPDGSLPRTAAPHEDTTMPRQWAHADFGEPSLDGVAHAPWLQQVDQMSASGHHGVSVTLLESALQVHRGKNPWVLTRLLDLYRAMDQPWNHERVSAQIEALYNVRVPPMHPGEPDRHDEGRSLEDDASLLGRIVDTWPRPEATIELLGTCLLRDRGQPATDIAEFRDLLLLYAIARQLTQPGDELAAT